MNASSLHQPIEVLSPENPLSSVRGVPLAGVLRQALSENLLEVSTSTSIAPSPAGAAALVSTFPTLRSVSLREPELRSGYALTKASPDQESVTHVPGLFCYRCRRPDRAS